MNDHDWKQIRFYSAVAFLLLWITAAVGWLTYLRHERDVTYQVLVRGHIEHWEQFLKDRQPSFGSKQAVFTIIEFSDYQCPFCRTEEAYLKQLADNHPGKVSLYRFNLPLESVHPFSRIAAIAAECAASQGSTERYQQALFARQNSFQETDWASLAALNGTPDIQAFNACLHNQSPTKRIEDDIQLADQLGIASTPTIIVNGNRLRGGVDAADLEFLYTRLK